MSSMREKIARAMCDGNWDAANFNETPNGESPEEMREYWLDKADAVLNVLEEPDADMIGDGVSEWCQNDDPENEAYRIFRAMIQAAKEGL